MDKLLNLILKIKENTGNFPCKKTVQKMVYLIQEKGINWEYDYSIHFYGPYSAELDSEIRYLNYCGKLNIDITSRQHTVSVVEENISTTLEDKAIEIIKCFAAKKPSDLELLTTALYVQREVPSATYEDICDGVIKIKKNKYKQDAIKSAIDELVNNDYFSLACRL